RRERLKSKPFWPESDFARFSHNPQDHVTQSGREKRTNTGRKAGIGSHQSWNSDTESDAGDYSADRYPIRNNEMLEVDKRSDDKERNKNPICDRHLPRKALPDREK